MRASRPTRIQEITALHFGISVETLKKGNKFPAVITARHIARYLERQRGLSYPQIAALYSCDHTTAIASYKHMVERLEAKDTRYVGAVEEIRHALENKPDSPNPLETAICPTCGAPVIAELRRQIEELKAQMETLNARTST